MEAAEFFGTKTTFAEAPAEHEFFHKEVDSGYWFSSGLLDVGFLLVIGHLFPLPEDIGYNSVDFGPAEGMVVACHFGGIGTTAVATVHVLSPVDLFTGQLAIGTDYPFVEPTHMAPVVIELGEAGGGSPARATGSETHSAKFVSPKAKSGAMAFA